MCTYLIFPRPFCRRITFSCRTVATLVASWVLLILIILSSPLASSPAARIRAAWRNLIIDVLCPWHEPIYRAGLSSDAARRCFPSRLLMRQLGDPPAPALDLAAWEKNEAARVIGSGAIFSRRGPGSVSGQPGISAENSDGIFRGMFREIFCRQGHF